jgi:DNA uptake protein ComE-like DNA-binding protein
VFGITQWQAASRLTQRMSTSIGVCSVTAIELEPPSTSASTGHLWPAGSRVVLGGLTVAAALWLALASRAGQTSSEEHGVPLPRLVVDANTAPREVLAALPSAGPALADRLVRARQERPLLSTDDAARRVRGLQTATLAQLAPYLKLPAATESTRASGAMPADRLAAAASKRAARRTKASPKTATSSSPRLVVGHSKIDIRLAIEIHDHD